MSESNFDKKMGKIAGWLLIPIGAWIIYLLGAMFGLITF